MIIDHLHDNKRSLQSCALVCKHWLPASRYHLFHSMSQKGTESEYVALLEFLLDAEHIRPSIRELRFQGRIFATTLLSLLRALPELTHFVMFNIVIDSYGTQHSWCDDLLIALFSMAKLTELRVCGDFLFGQPTLPLPALLASATGLSKLTYLQSYVSHKRFMPYLWHGLAKAKSAPNVTPLRMLDVPIDLADDDCDELIANEFSELLSSVGEGLYTLALDFRIIEVDFFFGRSPLFQPGWRPTLTLPRDIDRVLSAIDFSPCVNLRSLEVRILLDGWVEVLSLYVVGAVLARIPAASLEHLSIAVWNNDVLENLDISVCRGSLAHIDEVVCAFPKLKKMTFRSVSNDHGNPENDTDAALFEWIISHLPKIDQREGLIVGYAGGEVKPM